MTKEQAPTPHKTPYEVISELYSMPSDQSKDSRILVKGNVKTFELGDESSISIVRDGNEQPRFYVDIYGVVGYGIDQEEGLVEGRIYHLSLPLVNVQLGSFSTQVSLIPHKNLINVPKEHREEVGEILVRWTRKSIEEGRLDDPPFKLNLPLPKKQMG